jgi:dephospho-CoA kinase
MRVMLRVGLTGGIGAGKSTAAQALAALGATVIDADLLARRVVEPGTPGLAAVVAEFGESLLQRNGSLDRAALARVAFADKSARARLNAIVHPRIAELTAREIAAAPAAAVVVHDVPLLVENRLGPNYQLVLVVTAPEQERVRRLVAERGMTEQEALARMRAQADDAARVAAADVLFDNGGPPEALRAEVEQLWQERLLPFEENLRHGRPADRLRGAALVDPDPTWPAQASRIIGRVRRAAGRRALRIDHVGSTSVPGLVARDVIDLQVVVADLDAAGAVADDLREAGLVRPAGEWWDSAEDGGRLPKAMAQNADPGRAVNCHVPAATSPTWREVLLLRDWLRAHPDVAADYADLKRGLAGAPHESVDAYAEAKTPWIRHALERAEAWARAAGPSAVARPDREE